METSIQKQTENEKAIKIQFNQLKKKNEVFNICHINCIEVYYAFSIISSVKHMVLYYIELKKGACVL